MKRKIITTIITIIMMIFLKNNISEAATYSVQEIADMRSESVNQYVSIAFTGEMNTTNNKTIYCISEGQHNRGGATTYGVLTYIEIVDGVATMWDINHRNTPIVSSEANVSDEKKEEILLYNKVLAEILSGAHGELGYGTYNNYTNTQKALWYYFSTWIDEVGVYIGTNESWYVDNLYNDAEFGNVGTNVVNAAINAVNSGANPSVRFYLLNTSPIKDSWQRIMIAVPGVNEAGLTINKVDESNGSLLANVQFNIRNASGQYIITGAPTEDNKYSLSGYTSNESEATIFSTGDSQYQKITVLGLEAGWYTIKEVSNGNPGYNTNENIGKEQNVLVNTNASASVTMYNKADTGGQEPTIVYANVNISGFVWEDVLNAKSNILDYIYKTGDGDQDIKLSGIKVNWKYGDSVLDSTWTDENGEYKLTQTIQLQNHPYAEIDTATYQMLNNSYIEFEYNGIKYTTVAVHSDITDSTTSKGIEIETTRTDIDNKFNKVEDEKVYDANNNVIFNLPNASLTTNNYLDGYNATASTANVVGGLLSQAESYNWIRMTTFCTQHCYICECEATTCDTCKDYKHLAHTATEVVRARVPTFTKDTNGNGVIDTTEKVTTKGTGIEEEDQALIDAGWIMTDAGLEEVTVRIYCNGEIEYTSKDNNKYVNDLTDEQKAKYTVLIGEQYNEANGGLHYYSAEEAFTTKKHCLAGEDHIVEWNIYNMNLGLVKREQPNASLVSDIEKVRVIMKNQEYTYIYGNAGITDVDERVEYKLKWQNKYIAQQYSRPINPADIAYVNYNNSDELKVFVTYNMIAKNYSTTLPMTINKIVTYYDNDYTIFNGTGTVTSQGWTESGSLNSDYKIAYSTLLEGKTLAPNTQSEIIKIEFEVSQEAIKGLLKEDATLYTVSEIFSYSTFYGANTLCAEAETATTKNRVGKQYAGIDKNSTPGNAVPGNAETYEDDTDKAPSFLLEQEKDKYKIMTGTVWEDYQTEKSEKDNERLGDGIKNGEEKGVANVRVELICAETGQTADLYRITDEKTVEKTPAIVYTEEKSGNYTIGKDGYGIVVDNYILKYTYGNDTNIIQSGIGTQLYGSDTAVDARNYKSTIIVDEVVKNLIQGNTLVDDEGNNITDKWHLYMDRDKVISIAVDDLKERLSIPSLKYDNFDTPTNMSAYTRPFKLQVEYTEDNAQQMVDADGDGNIEGTTYRVKGGQTATFETGIDGFNFGIVERAREDIVVEKTISKIKLTLANGQILIEGDPREEKLNYVKAIGMYKTEPVRSRDQAKKASDKLLSIEIDSELIQGSILEMWYEVTVTNNSEYDYEYYADYTDIDQQSIFVTKDSQAKYYYYGDKTGLELIAPTIEIVADYMDSETICNVGDKADQSTIDQGIDNKEWYRYDSGTGLIDPDNTGDPITADRLKEKGYISEKTYKALKDGEYQIIVTDTFNELKAGGNSKTTTIYTSKLLASQEESNTFENHIEVLQLNSRIARTIEGVEDVWQIDTIRKQIEKSYKPGNYIPSLTQRTTNFDDSGLEIPGLHQPDDDRVAVRITPPTGISNYITIYIITAVIGLIVIVGGIIFIKKMVISK